MNSRIFDCIKRAACSFLTVAFFLQQSLLVPVFAESNISGVTSGGSGTFNIEPTGVSGSTGFRHYNYFNLGRGDIANLLFRLESQGVDITRFVNFVDNTVNINGILNTMRGNNFYNGHAIFISPGGMIIGASGVLNVGSLTAIAPSPSTYNSMKALAGGTGVLDANGNIAKKFSDAELMNILPAKGSKIDVNGKIIARDDVNLHANYVNVGSDSSTKLSTGIVTGLKNHAEAFSSQEQAEALFNGLVSHNGVSGSSMVLEGGKVVIKATAKETSLAADPLNSGTVEAGVDVKNASIAGGDVSITASATQDISTNVNALTTALLDVFEENQSVDEFFENYFSTSPYEYFDGARTKAVVDLTNADITAHGGDGTSGYVLAGADASSVMNVNSEVIGSIFPNLLYSVGTKTAALVNLNEGTIVNAAGKADVRAFSNNASAVSISNGSLISFDALSAIQLAILNSSTISETKAKVNSGSVINANDVSVSAVNSSVSEIEIASTASVGDNELKKETTEGGATTVQNGSGVSLNALIKNISTDTEVVVEGDINSTGTTALTAQSLSVTRGASESSTDDGDYMDENGKKIENPTEEQKLQGKKGSSSFSTLSEYITKLKKKHNTLSDKVDEANDFTSITLKSLVSKIQEVFSKVSDSKTTDGSSTQTPGTQVSSTTPSSSATPEQKEAWADLSGTLILNTSNIENTAAIRNGAKATSGNNVELNSQIVDLTVNKAVAEATGAAKVGAGLAVIVNGQNNKNSAIIDNATVEAANDVIVNATTELPMNAGELKFTVEIPALNNSLSLGLGVDSSGDGSWDMSMLDIFDEQTDEISYTLDKQISSSDSDEEDTGLPLSFSLDSSLSDMFEGLHPSFEWENFFNNVAQSTTNGSTAAVGGSVIYSNVVNSTNAVINNANVTSTGGNVSLNSANSVVGYNAAGMVDFIVKAIGNAMGGDDQLMSVKAGKAGIGGSVAVLNYDNNAKSVISGNSVINAAGKTDVSAATEQSYATAVATGGKAEGFALSGSVAVQNIQGETVALIENSTVKASDVSVNAGKAKIKTARKDDTYTYTVKETKKYKRTSDGRYLADDGTYLQIEDEATGTMRDATKADLGNVAEYDETLSETEYTRVDADPGSGAKYKFVGENGNVLTVKDKVTGVERVATQEDLSGLDVSAAPDKPEIDSSTGFIDTALTEREVNDRVSNILLGGALAAQSKKTNAQSAGKSSSGAAVGASVNVANINRAVKAGIVNSDITAKNNVDVVSNTMSQSINMAIAGAFAGGVSMEKSKQDAANAGDTANSNGSQKFGNFGQWADKLKTITDFFKSTSDSSQTASSNATGSTVTGQISDPDVIKKTEKEPEYNPNGTVKTDENGNPVFKTVETEYTYDEASGTYKSASGSVLREKDENGKWVEKKKDTSTSDALKSASGSDNSEYVKTTQVPDKYPDGTYKTDENGNVLYKDQEVAYKKNAEGKYVDDEGGVLYAKNEDGKGWHEATDADVAKMKQDSSSSLANANGNSSGAADSSTSSKNFSLAAAGSVNVNVNDTDVSSEIKGSSIKVGKNLNVKAEQKNKGFNFSGGVAKAGSVGAGAAVNVNSKGGSTKAIISADGDKKSEITFTSNNSGNVLNVSADEYNRKTDVAAGVGVAGSSESGTKTAVGGSFNVNVATNSVEAGISDADVNANGADISVVAQNYTDAYKGAGGLAIAGGSGSGTGVGAGIASNTNVIVKKTGALIKNSTVNGAKDVTVATNTKGGDTDHIISAAVAGAVVAGGSSSAYTFAGALGTDIVSNTISANILSSTVNASGDVTTGSYSKVNNANINGALSFSTSSSGVGAGLGTVVSVINNDVAANVSNSGVTGSNIDIYSNAEEYLRFLAVNMGIQTGGAHAINVNAIVSVLASNVAASVYNSVLNSTGDVSVASNYDNKNKGITLVGSGSSSGVAFGGNLLTNVYSGDTSSIVDENSKINAGGDVKVTATANEYINTVPVTVSASSSGSFAAAANIAANVLVNNTVARLSGKVGNAGDKVGSVIVSANDNTTIYTRGGTVAGSGGTAGVGGSVSIDVIAKEVNAAITDAQIYSAGKTSVTASAENSFGGSKDASGNYIVAQIGSPQALLNEIASTDLDKLVAFLNWQMTFDAAGGSTAGVSGSILTKVIKSNVVAEIADSSVYSKGIDVLASDFAIMNAIVGNITGGGTAAVGMSSFVNVQTGKTVARIGDNTVADAGDGDVNVDAKSKEVVRTISVVGGGAGTVAVNGSANVNVITGKTSALIGDNTVVKGKDVNVTASKDVDVQGINLAVSGAGTTSVGAVAYVNTFANETSARISGDDSDGIKSQIESTGNVSVDASENDEFSASMILASGSGTAAVSGLSVATVVASKVNAEILNSEISVLNGKANVSASYDYNKSASDKTAFLTDWAKTNKDNEWSTDDISSFGPLLTSLNVAGSGVAAVSGSLVTTVISDNVKAYVSNSEIATANGLDVKANSSRTTYDAIAAVAGSSTASVSVSGLTNVMDGDTTAKVEDSVITQGDLTVDANSKNYLNSILITATGAGTGAAVSGVVDTNTVVNKVIASIRNTNVSTSDVKVNATNNVNVNNLSAGGAGVGIGGAVTAIPVTNVFVGKTSASVEDSDFDNSSVTVNAKDIINTSEIIAGLAFSGMGGAVSGYVLTNVFDNDTLAFIENSRMTNSKGVSVSADSDIDVFGNIASGSVSGIGADVMVNGLTTVISNNVLSYLNDSAITGGNVKVSANQDTYIFDNASSTGINGLGNSSAVNAVVHVIKSKVSALAQNNDLSDFENAAGEESLKVSAKNKNDIYSNAVGVSASGTASTLVSTVVNVIEGETSAIIDSKDKNIDAKSIAVKAEDEILLKNVIGTMAGAGGVGAGAAVNANVVNNSVNARLLGSSAGKIDASDVSVTSDSVIGLNNVAASAAAGGIGAIAGTVSITSLGGKIDTSDKDGSSSYNMNTADTLAKSDETTSSLTDVSYEKDGISKSTSGSYDLTTGAQNEGTVAEVNANVETTSAKGLTVKAENTLKDAYGSDTAKITNAAVSGGGYTASASVLVTDVKSKTVAKISGGRVRALNSGKVDVRANSTVKADTNAVAATIGGGFGFGGNVAYLNNASQTKAQIIGSKVDTLGDITVYANAYDDIYSKSISAGVSAVNVALSIALAKTSGETVAEIRDSQIGTESKAKKVDVNANETTKLNSLLAAGSAGAATVAANVNLACADAAIKSLIGGNSSLNALNVNMISQTGGIEVASTMYLGTVAMYGFGVDVQGAESNAKFVTALNDTAQISASDVTMKSGTATDSDEAGNVAATVESVKGTVGYVTASVTAENAKANADSTITVANGASINATNNVSLISKLRRKASTGAVDASLGAISISGLILDSKVGGTSKIDSRGRIKGKNVKMKITDNSDAETDMIKASLTLASGNVNKVRAEANTSSVINVGNIGAENADISINNNKSAKVKTSNVGVSLANVGSTYISTKTAGTSGVNTIGKVSGNNAAKAKNLNISVKENGTSYNDALSGSYGLVGGTFLDISNTSSSAINNVIAGDLNAENVDITVSNKRNSISNAASTNAGLGAITSMRLVSKVENGSKTTFAGKFNADNLTVDSVTDSAVESYVHELDAGLVALAFGYTRNLVEDSVKNIVEYGNGADINVSGDINSTSEAKSSAYLFKESGNYGIFAVGGGELTNKLLATAQTDFSGGAKVVSGNNSSFKVKNSTSTPSEMLVKARSGGFAVSSGANLENTINQSANINVSDKNTLVKAGNALDIVIENGTAFAQYVESKASGFTAHNKAKSSVTANIYNTMNINDGTLESKTVNITMDSSNKLSSRAYVEAKHFAGQPKVYSYATLNVMNTLNIGNSSGSVADAIISASAINPEDTAVNISFMGNSVQDITQRSHVYVEAAVASADYGGSINYNTKNNVNVKSDGKIKSMRDINVLFKKNRSENLDSLDSYKKVSRAAFGIPITKSGSWSSAHSSSENNVVVDGTLEAGANNQMKMVIAKDGTVTETSLVEGVNYTKTDGTYVSSKTAEEIESQKQALQDKIDDLTAQGDSLSADKEANEARLAELQQQLADLNTEKGIAEYIVSLAADGKITSDDFKSTLKNDIKDVFANENGDYTYTTGTPGAGQTVISYVIDSSAVDELAQNLSYDVTESGENNDFNSYFYSNSDSSTRMSDEQLKSKIDTIPVKVITTVYDDAGNVISTTTTVSDIASTVTSTSFSGALGAKKNDVGTTTVAIGGENVQLNTYKDKIIYSGDEASLISDINNATVATNSEVTQINAANSVLDVRIKETYEDLADAKAVLSEVDAGTGSIYENGSFVFKDLNASGGTINIHSEKGSSNVTGSGKLVVSLADILIENYSNYNMIFGDLTVGSGKAGVYIDSKSYSSDQNPIKPSNLRITEVGTEGNEGCITINNFYDPSHPENNTIFGNIASDLEFNGTISTGVGNVNIHNEGGNIKLNDTVKSKKTQITVPQGDYVQNTRSKKFVLKEDDVLFAGGKIDITASAADIYGTVKAGNLDRNLMIDDTLIASLINDYVTGRDILLEDRQGNKSIYMNLTNNIKALLDGDAVRIFGIKEHDDSSIKITTKGNSFTFGALLDDIIGVKGGIKVGSNAVIESSSGYGKFNIINNTNYNVEINKVPMQYVNGGVTFVDKAGNSYNLAAINDAKQGALDTVKSGYNSGSFDRTQTDALDSIQKGYLVNDNTGALESLTDSLVAGTIKSYYSGEVSTSDDQKAAKNLGYGAVIRDLDYSDPANKNIVIDVTGASGQQTGDLIIKGEIKMGDANDGGFNLTLKTNGNLQVLPLYTDTSSTVVVPTINVNGSVTMEKMTADGGVSISGIVKNSGGNVTINNEGLDGAIIEAAGKIINEGGDVIVNNNGGSGIIIAGAIDNVGGDVVLDNETGASGVEVSGKITNKDGSVKLVNNENGDTSGVKVSGKVENLGGGVEVGNKGGAGAEISGTVIVQEGDISIVSDKGDTLVSGDVLLNSASSGASNDINLISGAGAGKVTVEGNIINYENGKVTINSNGTGGTLISGDILNKVSGETLISNAAGELIVSGNVTNSGGKTTVSNTGDKLTVSGNVSNNGGDLDVSNTGAGGALISGTTINVNGNTNISNSAGTLDISGTVLNNGGNVVANNTGAGAIISGVIKNVGGNLEITNSGVNGTLISGTTDNKGGNTVIENIAGTLDISGLVSNIDGDIIANNSGDGVKVSGTIKGTDSTTLTNSGDDGITVSGNIFNENGDTTINNSGNGSKLTLTTSGVIKNDNKDININNDGTGGVLITGLVEATSSNINVVSNNSDVSIGENGTTNDNYLTAAKDVVININNGSLLNNIAGTGSNYDLGNPNLDYKTLIKTGENLLISVKDGNVGASDASNPGFGINASSRNYTDSINVKVGGTVNVSAANETQTDDRLVNLRSVESDMKIDSVKADGNVILTAADWRQSDGEYSDPLYNNGYSIISADTSKTNVEGQNISIIASDNVGAADAKLNINQNLSEDSNSFVSIEAENNIYMNKTGDDNMKIHQIVAKRGDADLSLSKDVTINSITAGGRINTVSTGDNLTIYDLGVMDDSFTDFDDMLYPHDGLALTGSGRVVPETVNIEVRSGENGEGTLNIYTAYVKGTDDNVADVVIKADNLNAHAYDAPDSYVHTAKNAGLSASDGRTYSDNPTNPALEKKAKGFNTIGEGSALSFDIRGVQPKAGETRGYYEQEVRSDFPQYRNPNALEQNDYAMKNVSLSVNAENADKDRGMTLKRLYADDAYISTRDTNLLVEDGIINNFGEFRNRYSVTMVDNSPYRRILPADLQLNTEKTRSFYLIQNVTPKILTNAPIVNYSSDRVINSESTENSFYRLTLKDNKIQSDLSDDKDGGFYLGDYATTDKHQFADSEFGLLEVYRITPYGMDVENTGKLKVGDDLALIFVSYGESFKVNTKVSRVSGDRINVKYVDLSKADKNRLLYLQKLSQKGNDISKK